MSKPYTKEQIQEFEERTKGLSIAAKGVWIAVRMILAARKEYAFEGPPEALGWLIGCPSDILLTVLKEFELKACGFRVEWPPGNDVRTDSRTGPRTESVRLAYEADEKTALLSSSESLRLQKYREDKKKKEKKKMPENWNLSENMKAYGLKNGMSTLTVQHEFEKCRTYHLESEHTDLGWESRVFKTWVLNWISFGRKQVELDADPMKAMVKAFVQRGA